MNNIDRTLELIKIVEATKDLCIWMATGGKFDYKDYERNWWKLMSCPELKTLLPDWIISERYGSGYWDYISTNFKTYAQRRSFLRKEFDNILDKLKSGINQETESVSEASFSDGTISIVLHKEVFIHVKSLLDSKHYFNAVEEAYKIVRQKLKSITGKEKAHEWFKEENYEVIFWHIPKDEAEKDFFEGVKFLHMAIQNLRNEKSHTPAKELDKNLAIHYIVLASLAYDLINRNIDIEASEKVSAKTLWVEL